MDNQSHYKFDCGCEINILDQQIKDDGFPSLNIDYTDMILKLNYGEACPKVWDLLSQGKAKGVFQLETDFAQTWCGDLKPDSLAEMSALIAVLRPGTLKCVSGDTKISVKIYKDTPSKKDGYVKIKLKDLYHKLSNNKKFYNNKIISVNESTKELIENNINKIFYNGEQEVYKPKFKITDKDYQNNGSNPYKLECTLDHKLLTYTRGWIKLSDIQIGERVALFRLKKILKSRNNKTKKYVDGKSSFRTTAFVNYEYKCIFCDWKEASLDTNHIDGNRFVNNSAENLCILCPNHHKMYSENKISKDEVLKAREQYKLQVTNDIFWGEYLGSEYIGTKDTYDISVDSPNNNYIAGNVLVHNCMLDGKSMTKHYIDRKNGKDEVIYLYNELEEFLKPTWGILIYQEQTLQIARDIAGFSETEADSLRKAMGKKDPKLMASLREGFVNGCVKIGKIDAEAATQVFDWIEKSNRYLFNKSHSVSYAAVGYLTAWIKVHFPLHFYCSWLTYGREKMNSDQEIHELVYDAKSFNIDVRPPSLKFLDKKDDIIIDGKGIRFGIKSVKGIGDAVVVKFVDKVKEKEKQTNRSIKDWTWYEFLVLVGHSITSTAINGLICCGFLDSYRISRRQMLYEYDLFKKLTDKEKRTAESRLNETTSFSSLLDLLNDLPRKEGGAATVKRKQSIVDYKKMLDNPTTSLKDNPAWVITQEKALLGIPLSYTFSDILKSCNANATCLEFAQGKEGDMSIAAQIVESREFKIKNGQYKGQLMGFIKVDDGTAKIDCAFWSDIWSENKHRLTKGNIFLFTGKRSKRNSLSISKISDIF